MTGNAPTNSARVRFGVLCLCTIPFIYPFLLLAATALKPLGEFDSNEAGLPHSLTLKNITDAWSQAALGPGIVHSVIAVGLSVLITATISVLGASWFLRHRSFAARALRYVLIGTMAVPPPVFIIPLFVILARMNLTNNLVVLAFVYAAWNSSFGLYLAYAYFRGLPAELFEAAEIDGASHLQVLRRIIIPVSKPVISTLCVLSFIWAWSDLLLAIVLVQDPGKRLLTPSTALLADRFNTDTPANMAAALIALLPAIAVFAVGQRSLVRGILAGVGK